jgi:hypothetical protein
MVFLCRVFEQLEEVVVLYECVYFLIVFIGVYDNYSLAFVSLGGYGMFRYKFLVYLFNDV